MQNIIINNSTVTIINNEDRVSKAKDKLLRKLFYVRNNDEVMGGYKIWCQLLDWYFMWEYQKMYDYIASYNTNDEETCTKCLRYLEIIMNEGELK